MKKIYEISRMLRSHGMAREAGNNKFEKKIIKKNNKLSPKFIFLYPAYNFRNNEIGAAIGLKVASKFVPGLGSIASGKSSADLSLYDKNGTLLWNWSTRDLKTSNIGSNTDDLIEYLMKRATKKFPYFQRK